MWNEGAEAVKGRMKSFYGVRIVQCLGCVDGYTNTNENTVQKLKHAQMNKLKQGMSKCDQLIILISIL